MDASAPLPIAVLVKQDGLGDCCLRLPFLRALARGFPDRPIWWIAAYRTAMGTAMASHVAGMIAEVRMDTGICERSGRDVERSLRALPPFSFVFDLRTNPIEVWRAWRVLHHHKFFSVLPAYWFSSQRPPGQLFRPAHIGVRALRLAEAALGAPASYDNHLARDPAAAAAARALLPDGRTYVGLAPGSGEAWKNWPLQKFAELAAQLEQRGVATVIIRGAHEAHMADAILRALPGAIDSAAVTASVDGLIAITDRLALVVANDSGVGHVCGAAGRPVVSLFGRTDPRRWAPVAPVNRIIRARDFGGRDIDAIPVDAVLKAVEAELAARAHGKSGAAGLQKVG